MARIAFKYLLTAAVVVLVSEASKRSDRLGALLACIGLRALCFAGLATAVRGFGVNLWP